MIFISLELVIYLKDCHLSESDRNSICYVFFFYILLSAHKLFLFLFYVKIELYDFISKFVLFTIFVNDFLYISTLLLFT